MALGDIVRGGSEDWKRGLGVMGRSVKDQFKKDPFIGPLISGAGWVYGGWSDPQPDNRPPAGGYGAPYATDSSEAREAEKRAAWRKNFQSPEQQVNNSFKGLRGGGEKEETPEERLQALRDSMRLSADQRQRATDRARNIVGGEYNPLIKEAGRYLGDVRQERGRALNYANQAYAEARQEMNALGNRSVRADRIAARKAGQTAKRYAGTAAGADARGDAKFSRKSARMNRNFQNQAAQGMAAEAAMQKTALNAEYRRNISSARAELGSLKSQKKSKMQEVRASIVDKMRDRNLMLYQESLAAGDKTAEQKSKAFEMSLQLPEITKTMFGGDRRKAANFLLKQAGHNNVPRGLLLRILKSNRKQGIEKGAFQLYNQIQKGASQGKNKQQTMQEVQTKAENELWGLVEKRIKGADSFATQEERAREYNRVMKEKGYDKLYGMEPITFDK